MTFRLKPAVIALLCLAAGLACGLRAVQALRALNAGEVGPLLAYPLAVILPFLALVFLAGLGAMKSQEGALMQLGCMVQLVLILSLPGLALYLALGFPVVFLAVELFETRCPAPWRAAVKLRVIA